MNYQEAAQRLNTPIKKYQKSIGHKTKLHWVQTSAKDRIITGSPIALTYFGTQILTFYPDGRVNIDDGNWLGARCTQQKINEFLPRGWKLEMHPLRHAKKSFVALLSIRDEKYELLGAYPYDGIGQFTEKGRTDLEELNGRDARQLLRGAQELVPKMVTAFLSGEVSRVEDCHISIEDGLRVVNTLERLTLDVLDEKTSRNLLMGNLMLQSNMPKGWDKTLYWQEHYRLTGKARTQRAMAAQLEHQMKHPEARELRPGKNESAFHAMRRWLRQDVEESLLFVLGFRLFQR